MRPTNDETRVPAGALTRRDFLQKSGTLAGAVSLLLALSGEVSPSRLIHPTVFVCPPCGLDCDKLEFDKPGDCPACGMTLIEKGSSPLAALTAAGSYRFPDGKHSLAVPFDLMANGIFLAVTCNGKGPLNFEMDTGSFNSVVASEIVDELGIKTGASSSGQGSGTQFSTRRINNVQFVLAGGLILSSRDAAAISMGNLSNLIARRFDGNIGFDVLGQLVVRIDYAKSVITFFDPAYFRYTGTSAQIPFTFWSSYDPQIEGELKVPGLPDLPVKIVLDTGAGGTTLSTPFVNKHQLLQAGKTLQRMDVGAGGGESVRHELRAASLRIGGYVVDQPLMVMANDNTGTFAHAEFDINLGGNILRRFTVTINYPGKYLILEPNSSFHDPFRSDASGIVLKAEGPDYRTFVVTTVVQNSPASESGLRIGDAITAINGLRTKRYALWEVQEILKRSGTECLLEIKRDKTLLNKRIMLRALL